MKIVHAAPPMLDEIDAAFHVRGKPVIFAWGDTIYNPCYARVSPELLEHEKVHGGRQLAQGVEAWWKCYIADPEFRLREEIPGHQAEYRALIANQPNDRNWHHRALMYVAGRLAAPLYGGLVTAEKARKLILGTEPIQPFAKAM